MSTFFHTLVLFAAIAFVGCASKQPDAGPRASLEHTLWRLTEMNGQAVPATPGFMMPSLQLNPGGMQASGTSGVNNYTAHYVLNGTSLRFSSIAGTRMAGPAQAMQLESQFVSALSRVASWGIAGDQLDLKVAEQTVLRFTARETRL
jgi:heat shock protein HslJ